MNLFRNIIIMKSFNIVIKISFLRFLIKFVDHSYKASTVMLTVFVHYPKQKKLQLRLARK